MISGEIISAAAVITGLAGAVVSLYLARTRKTSLEIKNLRQMLGEARSERESMKRLHDEYSAATDTKIERLNTKIDGMYRRQNILQRAINAAWGCRHTDSHRDCPVIRTLTEEEDKA